MLQAYQDKTGGQVLAIAHNGNLSNGMMFPRNVTPADKQPLTREYATDAHTSLATTDDNNYWGKNTPSEPSATRAEHPFMKAKLATIMGCEQTAPGYAAVWATANTRAALWDAMKRKEVYATTEPRMNVRFHGGWDFVDADAQASDVAAAGYGKGVPMGDDLDRIQIIKGWVDAQGALQERVYDVAWSGDRKPGADGNLPAVGNTADVANATLHQQHRRGPAGSDVGGSGLRSEPEGSLLHARTPRRSDTRRYELRHYRARRPLLVEYEQSALRPHRPQAACDLADWRANKDESGHWTTVVAVC